MWKKVVDAEDASLGKPPELADGKRRRELGAGRDGLQPWMSSLTESGGVGARVIHHMIVSGGAKPPCLL